MNYFIKNVPFVVLLVLFGCHKNANQNEPLHCVEVIKPQMVANQAKLTYSGKVKENKQINVAFKVGGPIDKIHAQVGDRVRKGQLLAEIESSDYQLGVMNYEAQYEQLKNEVERITVLYEKKSVSQNDYEKAIAGLKQLEVAVQVNRNKLNYTKLYSPADGVIVAVNYHASELVDAGMAVFSLIEDNNLQVIFDIPASVYAHRADFAQFECYTTFDSQNPIAMQLVTVVPKADDNQLYRVYLRFKNATNRSITPGMNVEVNILMNQPDEQKNVSVPLRAICQRDEETFVWVVNADSTLRKQPVGIANIDMHGNACISEGLDGTESVVQVGAATLQDGERVRILQEKSATNIGNQL